MLGKIWLSCNLKKPLESLHRDTDHFKHDNYEMMLTDVHYLTKKKKNTKLLRPITLLPPLSAHYTEKPMLIQLTKMSLRTYYMSVQSE